jgi:hypothetical protein
MEDKTRDLCIRRSRRQPMISVDAGAGEGMSRGHAGITEDRSAKDNHEKMLCAGHYTRAYA